MTKRAKRAECPCCLERRREVKREQFHCEHRVCAVCHRKWRQEGKASCPLCRAPSVRPPSSMHVRFLRAALESGLVLTSAEVERILSAVRLFGGRGGVLVARFGGP